MTKPLHPGLAARDAVLAASLARNGFTADPEQLESPLGYFAMYAGGVGDQAVREALAHRAPAEGRQRYAGPALPGPVPTGGLAAGSA